jgi:phosphoserine phosphatase RsbU/P
MRIYAADDSEDARDIMAATLANEGYDDVTFAESGVELLASLGIDPGNPSAPEADLIMLDVQMPGIDGIETCARIRADARYQHTPILMVTSLDDIQTLNHAFVAGANDYINKPFHRIELHARLRSALRLKSELDRRRARERELLATQRQRRDSGGDGGLDSMTLLVSRGCVEGYIAGLRPETCDGLGVLALQIDRLPHYQTNYGLDAAMETVARIARSLVTLRGCIGDLLSHFDRGVYVAVLHNVDRSVLMRTAEDARKAVRGLAVGHRGAGSDDILTVSVGVAYDREPRALLPAAVSAMERASWEGGDRILFA